VGTSSRSLSAVCSARARDATIAIARRLYLDLMRCPTARDHDGESARVQEQRPWDTIAVSLYLSCALSFRLLQAAF
jgi:hypothetical protein